MIQHRSRRHPRRSRHRNSPARPRAEAPSTKERAQRVLSAWLEESHTTVCVCPQHGEGVPARVACACFYGSTGENLPDYPNRWSCSHFFSSFNGRRGQKVPWRSTRGGMPKKGKKAKGPEFETTGIQQCRCDSCCALRIACYLVHATACTLHLAMCATS